MCSIEVTGLPDGLKAMRSSYGFEQLGEQWCHLEMGKD